MKRYDEKILHKLLDRYENSLLYTGKNRVNITIAIPIQKRTLPEYFDESSMQFDVIHEQLEQLEEKGYIRLIWKNHKPGHILERCELNVEHTAAIYELLRRKPRNQKEQEIRRICNDYRSQSSELDRFLDWVETRMDEQEPVRKYVNVEETEEFEQICELILQIVKNDRECFLREFSIRHFHDSKIAEREIDKAVHIIAEFSEDQRLKELQNEEILEEYNIYRNPSWLMIKGYGCFIRKENEYSSNINLRSFPGGVGLSNQDIEKIYWNLKTEPEIVLTIENLTSFHQWNPQPGEKKVLCIYLGGYHNHVKRLFLQKLYEAYPNAMYCHFGDIDCGGFRIWKNLCLKTGILFRTFGMDIETYQKYLRWGRELTGQDKKTLYIMLEDPFFSNQKELFELMLREGKKLEQECIVVST